MCKERDIKDYFLKMLKTIDALARKVKYENRNGCPDWLVAHKGKLYLVELKSPTGKLTWQQRKEIGRYAESGILVITVYNYDDVDDFIEMIDE